MPSARRSAGMHTDDPPSALVSPREVEGSIGTFQLIQGERSSERPDVRSGQNENDAWVDGGNRSVDERRRGPGLGLEQGACRVALRVVRCHRIQIGPGDTRVERPRPWSKVIGGVTDNPPERRVPDPMTVDPIHAIRSIVEEVSGFVDHILSRFLVVDRFSSPVAEPAVDRLANHQYASVEATSDERPVERERSVADVGRTRRNRPKEYVSRGFEVGGWPSRPRH